MTEENNNLTTSSVASEQEFARDLQRASLIVKIVWPVLVIGSVLGVILWFSISGDLGTDLGALVWTLTFAACTALMALRQAILAERVMPDA